MDLKQQKRIVFIPIALALILLVTVGVSLLRKQQYIKEKQLLQESLSLSVDETKLTAYYEMPFDPMDAVTASEGNVEVQGNIDTSRTGDQNITYLVSKTTSRNETVSREFTYPVTVVDPVNPEIAFSKEQVEIWKADAFDPAANIASVCDGRSHDLALSEQLKPGTYTVEDNIDVSVPGEYTVTVHAMNPSGNTAEASYTVAVTEVPANVYPYRIRINRIQNCVTVYGLDSSHEYTVPVRAIVCSTGPATPIGVFHTFNRSTWRALFGNVYGQYATDIVGDILFHSVPYYSMNKNDLEYLEYNKLGTKASMGCIRMAVADALWIFTNCPIGTEVEIYDDAGSPGPLGKPEPFYIDENSEIRGWDPTDPDPNNPWNG